MAGKSVNPEKIIELLAELKTKTPDYPPELLEARKAAFMKQVISINLQGNGPGGESGGGSGGGGSGPSGGSGFFGGMSATQGMLLQATIGVWIIAAMLTAAYAFRNQIADLLRGNDSVNVEFTQEPSVLVAPVTTEPPPTEVLPTETPPATLVSGSGNISEELLEGGVPTETTNEESLTDENGRKLGLTPGAPDVPNDHGNPKTPNKDQEDPDQPDNPGQGRSNNP